MRAKFKVYVTLEKIWKIDSMVKFIFGIFFIMMGVVFINLVWKLRKTQDIGLIKNNKININKIKDKYSYVKFYLRIYFSMGVLCIIQGLICVLAIYFPIVYDI